MESTYNEIVKMMEQEDKENAILTQKDKPLPLTYPGSGQSAFHQPSGLCLLRKCLSGILARHIRMPRAHTLVLAGKEAMRNPKIGALNVHEDLRARSRLRVEQ